MGHHLVQEISLSVCCLPPAGPSAFALTLVVTRVEELEPRSLGNVVTWHDIGDEWLDDYISHRIHVSG